MATASCLNTNDPLFKEFESKFGYDNAYLIWALSDRKELPVTKEGTADLDEGKKIIDNASTLETDETFLKSNYNYKIQRIENEVNRLNDILQFQKMSDSQKATMAKLIQKTEVYLNFLKISKTLEDRNKRAKKTISVSNYTGTSIVTKTLGSDYGMFKEFGSFVHEVLEKITELNTLRDTWSQPADKIFTEEVFQKLIKETNWKRYKEINDLSDKELYNFIQRMVFSVAAYINEGCIIIPEVTVIGKNKDDVQIIGRIDILAIHPDGQVTKVDFKTKKVNNLLNRSFDNRYYEDVESAIRTLAIPSYKAEIRNGTGESFKDLGNRSSFEIWFLQQEAYANMLAQTGIGVKNSVILSFLYQVDEDLNWIGGSLVSFTDSNFYDRAITVGINAKNQDEVELKKNTYASRLQLLKKAVNTELPLSKEAEQEKEKTQGKSYEFEPEMHQMRSFVDKIRKLLEAKSKTLYNSLKNLQKNEEENKEAIEILTERKQTLRNLREIVDSYSNNQETLMHSIRFEEAAQRIEADIEEISKISDISAIEYYAAESKEEKTKHLEILLRSQREASVLKEVVKELENIVNQAAKKEGSKITKNSPLYQNIARFKNRVENIESNWYQVSITDGINVLNYTGQKSIEKVQKAMIPFIKTEIAQLRQKKADLVKGEGLKVLADFKHRFMILMSDRYKEEIMKQLDPETAKIKIEIENIEKQILKLESKLNGISYSDDDIQKLINSILDFRSSVYIGSNPWNEDWYLQSFNLDSLIADASNSERAIAMPALMYKDAYATANINIMDDELLQQFNNARVRLLNKFDMSQMNSALSETRKVVFYNSKTKMLDSKQELFFKKPYTQEYEQVFSEYNGNLIIFQNEINAARAELNRIGTLINKNDPNVTEEQLEEAKTNYNNKRKQYYNYKKNYINFLIDNVNTEYVSEYYKIQVALPDEIREKLQDLQFRIDTILITNDLGKQNAMLLSPQDFDDLKSLDYEINKLREEAKELSPEYAELIDRFKDMYDFVDNEKFYETAEANAKIKFANSPELLEQWYKENRVYKPKASWYEKINQIYEDLSEFYLENDKLKELFEQRNKIVRPYRKTGRMDPAFMSDEEIFEYDKIQNQIDEILNPGPEGEKVDSLLPGLTKEQKSRKTELLRELDSLKAKRRNPIYIDNLKRKTACLFEAYNNMIKVKTEVGNKLNDSSKNYTADQKKEFNAKINKAISNFENEEQQYTKWFNNNHEDEYESIDEAKNPNSKSPIDYAVPKNFNYEVLPNPIVETEYMEYRPNPKYYKLKVPKKDENGNVIIKNPDFIKPIDGILLPKNMMMIEKGVYMPKPGFENSTFTYTDKEGNTYTKPLFNAELVKLVDTPDLFDYYVKALRMYASHQSKVEGRTTGYRVPGIMAKNIENISEYGLQEAVSRSWTKFVDKNLQLSTTAEEYTNNMWGDSESRIRMRFTDQLPEDMQTKDVTNAIMQYGMEAHYNMAMQEVTPHVENFLELFKSQRKQLEDALSTNTKFIVNEKGEQIPVNIEKRIKDITAVIDQIEFMRRKYQYGQDEVASNRELKKLVNKVFAYTSFIRIGFDLTNQAKNYVSGNVQAFLAAGFESNHYTMEDYFASKNDVYSLTNGYISNYFRDWNKISDLHLSTIIYRRMNPLQKESMRWYSELSGKKSTRAMNNLTNWSELGFSGQEIGDTEIGITVMNSIMRHYKYKKIKSYNPETGEKIYELDKNGEPVLVSAIDCYVRNEDGTSSTFDSTVEYGIEDEKMLRNIIYSEVRRAQGNYAKMDKTRLEETVGGKMVLFFRKFLIPQLANRFGYLRPNYEGSDVSYGYWRAMMQAYRIFGPGKTIGEFVLGRTVMSNVFGSQGLETPIQVINPDTGNIESIEPGESYSRYVAHARRDAFAMVITTILSMLALSYIRHKDDDDDELSILEGNTYRLITGVQGETTSMMPLGGGSQEYIRNFTTGIPFVRELTAMKKFMSHMIDYSIVMTLYGGEEPDPEVDSDFYIERYKDGFFQRKSGNYQEGDPKIVKDLVDLTGIRNIRDFIDPNYRVDQLKRNQ